jgi:hypothetical protein
VVRLTEPFHLPAPTEQVNPEKSRPPYDEKGPAARPDQSKPWLCFSVHSLSVLSGEGKHVSVTQTYHCQQRTDQPTGEHTLPGGWALATARRYVKAAAVVTLMVDDGVNERQSNETQQKTVGLLLSTPATIIVIGRTVEANGPNEWFD